MPFWPPLSSTGGQCYIKIEVYRNKWITTLIHDLLLYVARHKFVHIHQLHVTWGASGDTTTVAMFLAVWCVFWMVLWRHETIICKKFYKNNHTIRLMALLCVPHWLAPHLSLHSSANRTDRFGKAVSHAPAALFLVSSSHWWIKLPLTTCPASVVQ